MAVDFKKFFSFLNKTAPNARPDRVVGIDFGSSSIKVVEIKLDNEVLTLSTYGELQLGPYAQTNLGSAVELLVPKQVEAVVDIMRESEVTAKNGIFALPLSDSFVTIMTLAAKKEEDIAPRVNVEARKYIPIPLNQVKLEWSEIPQKEGETQPVREVLLAAIQNEALANRKALLDAIKMKSQPSEIELFSTLRAVTRTDDVSVAVIDIGAAVSKLYISENGFLRRIHRVQFGGAHATQVLSKRLQVSFEEAENLKRNYTPQAENGAAVREVMAQVFDRPFQEFARVIQQYEMRTGAPVSRIVLCGGSTIFADFTAYASNALNREVELNNPFAKVAYPAFMEDTLKEIGPVFTVALGAALRPFEVSEV